MKTFDSVVFNGSLISANTQYYSERSTGGHGGGVWGQIKAIMKKHEKRGSCKGEKKRVGMKRNRVNLGTGSPSVSKQRRRDTPPGPEGDQ